MIVFNRYNTALIALLELISLAPILIILGNIVPPFPIKIHHIAFGFIFLLATWILAQDSTKKWILYLAGFYFVIQFTFESWEIKNIVDFFFGPFVLLILVDILVNKKLPENLLRKYARRFLFLLWVPILIAFLQFFELLPLTIWNATYLNHSLVNGVYIPRPNGFLYHGSELSIIICFTGLFQYFRNEASSFWTILLLIFIALATYYKMIVACMVFLFLFFLLFVNRGKLSRYQLISKKRIFWYSGITGVLILILVIKFVSKTYEQTGYLFPQEMLTGRGQIWNVYLKGIHESYSFGNYLFGNGMGSYDAFFKTFATKDNFYPLNLPYTVYYPHAHNAVLSIFLNSGIVGILFHLFLFKIIYNQVVKWNPDKKWNKTVFFAIFIIPTLTLGVTIIIFETAIIWPSIGFLFYKWHHYSKNLDVAST